MSSSPPTISAPVLRPSALCVCVCVCVCVGVGVDVCDVCVCAGGGQKSKFVLKPRLHTYIDTIVTGPIGKHDGVGRST